MVQGTTECVESVQFGFYTEEEVEELSCKTITEPFFLDNLGRPVPGSLYDPALGPLDEYSICKTCGQISFQCPGHWGRIPLALKVYNPLLFKILYDLLKITCFKCHHFRVQRCVSKLELIIKGDVAGALDLVPSENGHEVHDNRVRDNSKHIWTSLQLSEAVFVLHEFMKKMSDNAVRSNVINEGKLKQQLPDGSEHESTLSEDETVGDLSVVTDVLEDAELKSSGDVHDRIQLLWEFETPLCSFICDIQQESFHISKKKGNYSMFFIESLLLSPIKFRPPSKGGDTLHANHQKESWNVLRLTDAIESDCTHVISSPFEAVPATTLAMTLHSAMKLPPPPPKSAPVSEDNLLGEGSLGSVYKANFPDGKIFAVKNVNTVALSLHEEEQFLDVIWNVARLRHPNIVTLVGYCMEHGQHLLVYEYIPNWSLVNALHCNEYKHLPWSIHIKIALGVARALDYLHSACSPPVAHNNLKAANILLGDDLMPYLCDCGLNVLRPLTSNSVKLKASEMAVGCTGYTAPESSQPGTDKLKSDIFAFGVLLLELLTGRKPFDSSRPRDEQCLVKWASTRLHDHDSLEEMVDPVTKRMFSSESLSRFADIITLCIQAEPEFRPTMSEVVEYLVRLIDRGMGDGAELEVLESSFKTILSGFNCSPLTSYASA
ncbi:hypothetical protein GIB67_015861 [Kingdonia uniflora]|uniref:DNA-directed RNA polymerase n=1 Tax=Kingdonia uniflora TaxID=39325 RepID=A0A7J7NF89_9MAGN|nr:hypothetical protein GIB67_015861 [Kingdonia uniflora]